MASPPSSRLQHALQLAVQSLQWTYSLSWLLCPEQGVLVWGDGYYNGAIKTRKTVQPMEVSTEDAALQRSRQLRELYDSLSAGVASPPARRPCAALSPEDLTESEWFYLMCVSFSFAPGVGLPGKAYTRRKHVWLTRANEADSRVFSRAILAKSAGIQTVVCIPITDGVLELGTTEKVEEDLGLIHHAKSFFADHHDNLKPALSGHSASNSAEHLMFHFQPTADVPPMVADTQKPNLEEEEEDEHEEEDDHEDNEHDEEEAEAISDSEAITAGYNPAVAEPVSELMQLEMSEGIRLGSPDDCSDNLNSELQMLAVGQANPDVDYQSWQLLHEDLCKTLEQPPGTTPQVQELSEEDAHYSQTVSAILQSNSRRWGESSSAGWLANLTNSAFMQWKWDSDYRFPGFTEGASQRVLKFILLNVPNLHCRYRKESSPGGRDSDAANRFRKGAAQEELSANHVLSERRRREKLNERFIILRSLVPFVTKMDKASILGDAIEYVKQLRRRIQDLESRISSCSGEANALNSISSGRILSVLPDKRKMRVMEAGGGVEKTSKVAAVSGTNVQVSIIEGDALLELQCSFREGLFFRIMQALHELKLEINSIQSSTTNGVFAAELRAKVKEMHGKRASILEVKKAIHKIFSQF